jgi:hypothetical protein
MLTQVTQQTATATTTNLSPGPATLPALAVGSEYAWDATFYAGRGATTTACSLIVELLLGGVVVRSHTLAILATANSHRGGRIHGRITCRTTGAAGSASVTLEVLHDLGGAAGAAPVLAINPVRGSTPPPALTVNTTVPQTTEVRIRLSAGIATCYAHMTHCTLYPVKQ